MPDSICIRAHNVFAFSDTHGHHRDLRVLENADILICSGDAVEDNLQGGEYDDFIDWFSSQKAKWKIFVGSTLFQNISVFNQLS